MRPSQVIVPGVLVDVASIGWQWMLLVVSVLSGGGGLRDGGSVEMVSRVCSFLGLIVIVIFGMPFWARPLGVLGLAHRVLRSSPSRKVKNLKLTTNYHHLSVIIST